MRKHNSKKLTLDTTTLRTLDNKVLTGAAGGRSAAYVACGTVESCSCPKHI